MYAYSGANTMYRRNFLINVGGFRQDRATEDISIAWYHTFMNVTQKFAPDIVFHMNVPETFRDVPSAQALGSGWYRSMVN